MVGVSAIVLTLNEEKHIRACLESLRWCDETWVVDSGSADRTVDICREFTENIVYHDFQSFSAQRQWALTLPIRNDWVLFVDSDERIPPALAEEIRDHLAEAGQSVVGYYIPHKQYFWGKCLTHGECWPCYGLKLFRKDKVRWSGREVHENTSVDGPAGFLQNPVLHIAFENISEIVDKLNRYSSLEAIRMYRTGQQLYSTRSPSYSYLNNLLKLLFGLLPCKPFLKFAHDYFVRRGFLDGREGFAWAVMQGFYVWLSYFKLWEMRRGIVRLENLNHDRPVNLDSKQQQP